MPCGVYQHVEITAVAAEEARSACAPGSARESTERRAKEKRMCVLMSMRKTLPLFKKAGGSSP